VSGVEFDDIESLRRSSAAWRLLRADHAALVLGFLGRVFVEENIRSISGVELTARLDDELYALNERFGAGSYPKPARAYLDDWSRPEVGWLRKFYPPASDEVHIDATPAVERALAWVQSLQARSFVGTESRLNIAFELLRQMAFGAETDPDVRLAELHRRRAEIDAEISQVRSGEVHVLDSAGQRDRYQQFVATARGLLADFREVEANFRTLDRELREQIAAWTGAKGQLLDVVLGSRNAIGDSDQGRSFHAFYDFLLSPRRQQEFTDLLSKVQSLADIGEADPRMRRIHHDWLDAAERTQGTVRLLSEQLRRFLDDQVWLENRRVVEILRSIESHALALRDRDGPEITYEVEGVHPTITLPMERPLYRPRTKVALDSSSAGTDPDDVDVSLLFEQVYVDPARLSDNVRRALRGRSQLPLTDLIADEPLEQGLVELVMYLSLKDPEFEAVFDDRHRDQVRWQDLDGRSRVATIPTVTFVRTTQRRVGLP
jgi:hypothetical protein